ncbi:MAG: hypothetical protein IPP82_17000 [Xanthomonadales bacterium]|nr:hypothetical protein [Xanthomonadales bacterium]
MPYFTPVKPYPDEPCHVLCRNASPIRRIDHPLDSPSVCQTLAVQKPAPLLSWSSKVTLSVTPARRSLADRLASAQSPAAWKRDDDSLEDGAIGAVAVSRMPARGDILELGLDPVKADRSVDRGRYLYFRPTRSTTPPGLLWVAPITQRRQCLPQKRVSA